jgi:hypothetical protein
VAARAGAVVEWAQEIVGLWRECAERELYYPTKDKEGVPTVGLFTDGRADHNNDFWETLARSSKADTN